MVKKALIIAVKVVKEGPYQELPHLTFAHQDAIAVAQSLISNFTTPQLHRLFLIHLDRESRLSARACRAYAGFTRCSSAPAAY